jgi:hypothetical protein
LGLFVEVAFDLGVGSSRKERVQVSRLPIFSTPDYSGDPLCALCHGFSGNCLFSADAGPPHCICPRCGPPAHRAQNLLFFCNSRSKAVAHCYFSRSTVRGEEGVGCWLVVQTGVCTRGAELLVNYDKDMSHARFKKQQPARVERGVGKAAACSGRKVKRKRLPAHLVPTATRCVVHLGGIALRSAVHKLKHVCNKCANLMSVTRHRLKKVCCCACGGIKGIASRHRPNKFGLLCTTCEGRAIRAANTGVIPRVWLPLWFRKQQKELTQKL